MIDPNGANPLGERGALDSSYTDPMVCYSGRRIRLDQICAADIDLADIVHALSLVCRAGGHIRHFYSIAQHSLNCAAEAKARGYSRQIQLACLLHDAGEAYLSDVIRPVKGLLPDYRRLEQRVDAAIWAAFGLSSLSDEERALVRDVDNAMLHHEFLALRHDLVIFAEPPLCLRPPDCAERPPAEVRADFVALYHELKS